MHSYIVPNLRWRSKFREAEGFRCFGGTASAEVPVERCPTASALNDRPGGPAVGSLDPKHARFLTLATSVR